MSERPEEQGLGQTLALSRDSQVEGPILAIPEPREGLTPDPLLGSGPVVGPGEGVPGPALAAQIGWLHKMLSGTPGLGDGGVQV